MASRRKKGLCLLCSRNNCFEKLDTETDEDGDVIFCAEVSYFGGIGGNRGGVLEEWEVPGSEDCAKLKRQFVNMFVLKKILDIPGNWCERKLPNNSDKNVSSWIQICDDCLSTGVVKASTIHRQIKELEESFKDVKQEIKETMKERMERMKKRRNKNNNERSVGNTAGSSGGGRQALYDEIVRLSFAPAESSIMSPDLCTGGDEISTTFSHSTAADEVQASESGHLDNPNREAFNTMGDDHDDQNDDLGGDDGSVYEPEHGDNINDIASGSDEDYDPTPKRRKTTNSCFDRFKKNRMAASNRESRRKQASSYCKTCKICNSRHRSKEDFEAHLKAHEENDALGDQSFTCPLCKFPCQSTLELEVHTHTRHVIPGRLKNYKCQICSFQTKTKTWKSLKQHSDSKHPNATEEELGEEVVLKCFSCKIQFSNPKAYHSHQRTAHKSSTSDSQGEQGLVQCPECGVLEPNADLLIFHMMSKHKRTARFVCETCGKGFMRQDHLQKHQITHVRHIKRDFVCHICGMDYAYQFTLDDHHRKHHSSSTSSDNKVDSSDGEVYKCRYCDLTSPFSVVISRHLQTHKEQNGHRCDKCGKYYMNSQGLRRHLIINHSENKHEKFQCHHCFKLFASQNAVQGHLKYHCRIKKLLEQKNLSEESSSSNTPNNSASVLSMTTTEAEIKQDLSF